MPSMNKNSFTQKNGRISDLSGAEINDNDGGAEVDSFVIPQPSVVTVGQKGIGTPLASQHSRAQQSHVRGVGANQNS